MDKTASMLYGVGLLGLIYTIYNKDQIYDWLLSRELKKQANEVEDENRGLKRNTFTFDRIIDGDCNGKPLMIGIFSRISKDTITTYQGIRWGDDKIIPLKSFTKENITLLYIFEDDTTLKISKNEKNEVSYVYESKDMKVEKKINDIVLKAFKTIDMRGSEAIDKIAELK